MGNLLIVGTVAFDDIETPFGKSDRILGGAATFIGLSASYFKLDSGIISVVGGDFPKSYLDIFTERNIDISGLKVVEEGRTFYWKGKYDYNLNDRETLVTDLNVLADFNPVVPEKYRDCDFLMLGNLHPDVKILIKSEEKKVPVLLVPHETSVAYNISSTISAGISALQKRKINLMKDLVKQHINWKQILDDA